MITADYGNGIIEVDEKTLRKADGSSENDHESTSWVEYWDGEQCVHRSAHVRLKQGLGIEAVLGKING